MKKTTKPSKEGDKGRLYQAEIDLSKIKVNYSNPFNPKTQPKQYEGAKAMKDLIVKELSEDIKYYKEFYDPPQET